MPNYLESVNTEQFVILHHNDRYLLFSIVTGKPIVTESFTVKRLMSYLVDLRDAEDDEDEIYSIAVDIGVALNTGVFGCEKSFKECIALNTLGEGGQPMPYEQFVACYFQKGAKEVYRCENCNEAVRIPKEETTFAGNGGIRPVSDFCFGCNPFFARDYPNNSVRGDFE